MARRKNHPKKLSPPTSDASATPSESDTSTPPSPALPAAVAPVTEIPSLPISPPSELAVTPAVPTTPEASTVPPADLSGAPIAEAPAPGLIRSMLRWVPILGRFV